MARVTQPRGSTSNSIFEFYFLFLFLFFVTRGEGEGEERKRLIQTHATIRSHHALKLFLLRRRQQKTGEEKEDFCCVSRNDRLRSADYDLWPPTRNDFRFFPSSFTTFLKDMVEPSC